MSLQLPVYMDHAATTPVAPRVIEAMLPYFGQIFANPATLYASGAEARDAVDSARETVAAAIGAQPEEIYFTAGGTEADNWAIKGMAATAASDHRHMLVSAVEHHAVLDSATSLRRAGFDVELIPVNGEGRVEPAEVARRIRTETFLVSVMQANNEVGAIQPIAEIGALCRERGVPLHTDAVQSYCRLPIDVDSLGVSLLTLSAHKIYGPKGAGALYVRRGVRPGAFMEGGEQEAGRRAGTLNVPGIVGLSSSTSFALQEMEEENRRCTLLRDRLIDGVLDSLDGVRLTGSRTHRLSGNVHFCVEGVEGESLLLSLDMAGVAASAGSACTTGSVEPSHVLIAMGIPVQTARGALRLTLGRGTGEEAVDYTIEQLTCVTKRLRSLG